MEQVDGIGGFFFRAADPDGLAAWYEQHLGIDPVPTSYGATVWTQREGPTVIAPFGADAAESPVIGRGGWASTSECVTSTRSSRNFGRRASTLRSTKRTIRTGGSPS